MGLFDSFTGKSQRRDIGYGNEMYNAHLRKGLQQGRRNLGNALARFDPYAEFGQEGIDAYRGYGDAIGARGEDARAAAFETFESDPFRDFANQETENALRDSFRRYNAAGMADSGANRLATGRVAGQFARQDINDYFNRLRGYGADATRIGMGAAGSQAGIDQSLADLETSTHSALGNQGINYGNALASSRNIGINNLMGLAGLATNAYGAYRGIPKKVG